MSHNLEAAAKQCSSQKTPIRLLSRSIAPCVMCLKPIMHVDTKEQ